MRRSKTPYVGIDKDADGGMTVAGRIIRDAWAFGIIPENETCAGWNTQALEDLWTKTHEEWEKYGHQVNNLPDDIRERYMRIQKDAFQRARDAGWDASLDDSD
jgi:Cu2+-containing amine oxidase